MRPHKFSEHLHCLSGIHPRMHARHRTNAVLPSPQSKVYEAENLDHRVATFTSTITVILQHAGRKSVCRQVSTNATEIMLVKEAHFWAGSGPLPRGALHQVARDNAGVSCNMWRIMRTLPLAKPSDIILQVVCEHAGRRCGRS